MGETKPFTAVTLCKQYPQHDVAEHEVFMSFVNDAHAVDFQEWWQDEGAVLFNGWMQRTH